MPLYEYRCENCQDAFRSITPVQSVRQRVACPACATTGARRLISTCAAISRGDGDSRLVTGSQGGGCGSCAGGRCATCGH